MKKMEVAAFILGVLGLLVFLGFTLFEFLPTSTNAFGAFVLDVCLALSAAGFAMGLTGMLEVTNKLGRASGALAVFLLIVGLGPARNEREIATAFFLANGGHVSTGCAKADADNEAITRVEIVNGSGDVVQRVTLSTELQPNAPPALIWYTVPSAGEYYVRAYYSSGDASEACALPPDRKLKTSAEKTTLTFRHVK